MVSSQIAQDDLPRNWVLVAGGFHRRGGMDAANAGLALYLAEHGCKVHLVGHFIDDQMRANNLLTFHEVPRPASSYFLGQWLLERAGQRVARATLSEDPAARVIVNGGNCDFPDVNWVHSVHQVWPVTDRGAPTAFRIKHLIEKNIARRMERSALSSARVIIANSNRTRLDLIGRLGVPADRVHTVYLGAEPRWKSVTCQLRMNARSRFDLAPDRTVIAFIGALGHDLNKGFDTLWEAWQKLCALPEWDADLLVAGGGRALDSWRARIEAAGLRDRVTMLGHTDAISDVLAAADLLVSPVRYEAYGLGVHEALCCGVPAMVSATAGVAERYPDDLRGMLIPDPEDAEDLVTRLLEWRKAPALWKARVQPLARELRSQTWNEMAAEIVTIARNAPPQNGARPS
jgi:glycosyltransferase involved in cell wall biosynthesis